MLKMEEQNICQLTGDTIRLISSTQIATSVSSVVKELLENSLDAAANSIQVKLENYGLDLIEVKDDGPGLGYENVQKMFLPGYTSKLTNFQDLGNLQTYGFRGEALSAICKLGETVITTKTERDSLAMTYFVNPNGTVDRSKPSHIQRGTIVSVKNIFSSLPVRKQYASSKKKMVEELKKVENILQALSVIHPTLRLTFIHNKNIIWQKNSVTSLKQSFMQVVGLKVASRMDYIKEERDPVTIELIIPKKDLKEADGLFLNSMQNMFIHINKRPVFFKEITKVITKHICHRHMKSDATNKLSLFLASITVPFEVIDVNLEPNKTKVLLKNLPDILLLIDEMLSGYYGHTLEIPELYSKISEILIEADNNFEEAPPKKAKLDDVEIIPTENVPPGREWSLTIVDDEQNDILAEDIPCTTNFINTICSQINKDNCTLTNEMEEAQLNNRLINSGNKLVANLKVKGYIDAGQSTTIQENGSMQILGNGLTTAERVRLIPSPETVGKEPYERLFQIDKLSNGLDTNEERNWPIIPDWPTRQKTPVKVSYKCSRQTPIFQTFGEKKLGFEQPHNPFSAGDSNYSVVSRLSESSRPIVNECPLRQTTPRKEMEVLFTSGTVNRQTIWKSHVANKGDECGDSAFEKSTTLDPSMIQDAAGEKITAASWSRGHVQMNDRSLLDGGAAVLINASMEKDVAEFDLSLQSVSSQMGKKELSAFTKFARIMRPKITTESPGILFTEVSKLLVQRWKALNSEEMGYYEDMAKIVDEERKIHKQQKENTSKVSKKGSASELLTRTKKLLIKRPLRKKTMFSVSVEKVKTLRIKSKPGISSSDITLIGKIDVENGWLYLKNNEVGHIRHMGLQELVLFYKMMNNLEISRKKLENHQLLTEEFLGAKSWLTLLSLPNVYVEESCRNIVVSDIIVKNGFHIELLPSASGRITSALLTEVPACIESHGVSELKEIIHLIDWHGHSESIFDLRPNAVKNYIMNEVKRIVSQNPHPPCEEDMKHLLRDWENSKHSPTKCFHDREVLVPFYTITRTEMDQF